MASKHSGAAFNHSCLKMPVNPSNKLPYTSYERKRVTHVPEENSTNRQRCRKSAHFQGSTNTKTLLDLSPRTTPFDKDDHQESFSQVKSLEGLRIMPESAHNPKDSFESFINFYESIPDYGDVKNLSDREFNIQLQHLKDKQKLLTGYSPATAFNSEMSPSPKERYTPVVEESDVRHSEINNPIKNMPAKTDPVSTLCMPRPIPKPRMNRSQDNNGNIRKHDTEMKCDPHSRVIYELQQQHTLYRPRPVNINQPLLDKESIGTPSTISISSVIRPMSPVGSVAPLKSGVGMRVNNYLSDSDGAYETRPKQNTNINEMILKEKYNSRTYRSDYEKHQPVISPKHKYGSLTQSPCSNKNMEKLKVDSSMSIIDSATMWDGFSADENVIKPDVLYSDLESLLEEQYLSRSVPNSPTFKSYSKSVAWKEPKITIPKPFSMTMREEDARDMDAIKHDIYSDLIDQINLKEENKSRFKAHPVPLQTQLPLFEKIMHDQEKRRRKVKKQCVSELRAQMRPFSFVTRDKERRRHRLCCSTPDLRTFRSVSPKPFKARPVPKNLFGSLVYQKMREDEYYRALKKKIRAEELLKASSLPPSMAAREEVSRIMSARAKMSDDSSLDRGNKHRRSRTIPDYKTSHDLMRQELAERRLENVSTSPQPFRLRTSELRPRAKRASATPSPYECYSSPTSSHERSRPRSALCFPSGNRNNLASVLRIQSARRRLEHEVTQKREETRKLEEARMKTLTARRHPVWQALNYSTSEDLAIRVQTRREEERLRSERHQHEMEMMLDRVDRIPPLFLRQTRVKTTQSKRRPASGGKSSMKQHMSLAYSSPDLFGGTEDNYPSDASDDGTSKAAPAKVVSINETVRTFRSPESSSRDNKRGKTNAASSQARQQEDVGTRENENQDKTDEDSGEEGDKAVEEEEDEEDEDTSDGKDSSEDEESSDSENNKENSEVDG